MVSTTSTPLSQRVRKFLDAHPDERLTSAEVSERMKLIPAEAKAIGYTLRDMATYGKANRVKIEKDGRTVCQYFSTHGIDRTDTKPLKRDGAAAALSNPPRGAQRVTSDKGTAYTPNSSLEAKITAKPEGCTRSHPHENMSAECEQKTVEASKEFEQAGGIDGHTADRLAKNGTPEPGQVVTNELEVLRAANRGLGERIERVSRANAELMKQNEVLTEQRNLLENTFDLIHGVCTDAGIARGYVVQRVRDLAAMKTITLERIETACATQSDDSEFWRGIAGDALKLAQRITEAAKNGQ